MRVTVFIHAFSYLTPSELSRAARVSRCAHLAQLHHQFTSKIRCVLFPSYVLILCLNLDRLFFGCVSPPPPGSAWHTVAYTPCLWASLDLSTVFYRGAGFATKLLVLFSFESEY